MAQLKVGLAPNRTSYYDQLTNTYITLQAPVQTIVYDETNVAQTVAKLERITHALLGSIPALVLYEGNLPQASIDAWKEKYTKPFKGPTTRNIVVGGKVIGSVPITDPLRNGIDFEGRAIEPNRAHDRAAKKEKSDVTGASTAEKVEVLKADELEGKKEVQIQEEVQEKPEVQEEEAQAATRAKRQTSTKTTK